jgi:hypothetical protein
MIKEFEGRVNKIGTKNYRGIANALKRNSLIKKTLKVLKTFKV